VAGRDTLVAVAVGWPDGRPKFFWPTWRDGMLENGLRTDALSCFEIIPKEKKIP